MRVSFTNMTDFVRDLTDEVNDPGGNFTTIKLLRIARSSLVELNLWVIPNFESVRVSVGANGLYEMPVDTIRPIQAWQAIKCSSSGSDILLELGQLPQPVRYPDTISCADVPEATVKDCVETEVLNYLEYGANFWLYSPWYQEQYGKRATRFFGWWSYDTINNRIEFVGPAEGDVVVITSQVENDDLKLIPNDVVPMLRHKVLHRHYLPSNPSAAGEHWRQFKLANRMYQRHRKDHWSQNDWMDAITSEYASSLSP